MHDVVNLFFYDALSHLLRLRFSFYENSLFHLVRTNYNQTLSNKRSTTKFDLNTRLAVELSVYMQTNRFLKKFLAQNMQCGAVYVRVIVFHFFLHMFAWQSHVVNFRLFHRLHLVERCVFFSLPFYFNLHLYANHLAKNAKT